MMPLYGLPHNVNSATAAQAANSMNSSNSAFAGYSMPPAPSYLYGPAYSGSTTPPTRRFGADSTLPVPIRTLGGSRPLVTPGSRRGLLQLPTSPSRLVELELASPEAEKSTMVQSTRSRTRNNLPKETTYILLKWLNDHLSHPYPNSFEKTQLMMTTGLSQQQLSNWFINARRRKIKVLRQKQRLTS